jgi:hypothetical protein
MTVTYDSLDAKLIAWASARLAASPLVRTLLDAADAGEALAKIIELDTDLPGPGALVVVSAPRITSTRKTVDGFFEGSAVIRAVIEWPPTDGDTLTESQRRAANIAGTIRSEIIAENDQFLMMCDSEIPERRDDTDGTDRAGWFTVILTLTCGPIVC